MVMVMVTTSTPFGNSWYCIRLDCLLVGNPKVETTLFDQGGGDHGDQGLDGDDSDHDNQDLGVDGVDSDHDNQDLGFDDDDVDHDNQYGDSDDIHPRSVASFKVVLPWNLRMLWTDL